MGGKTAALSASGWPATTSQSVVALEASTWVASPLRSRKRREPAVARHLTQPCLVGDDDRGLPGRGSLGEHRHGGENPLPAASPACPQARPPRRVNNPLTSISEQIQPPRPSIKQGRPPPPP